MMKSPGIARVVLLSLIVLSLAGCRAIGPKTVARDRLDYTHGISESWKRQMLLNLVKFRYGDAPVFMDVVSVINQYAMETEVQGGLSWNAFLPEASQSIGAKGRYSDRPTITYQPIAGEKFTRSLMTPIPPSAILSLIQAGWRADMVSRACIQAVNGIYNRSGAAVRAHPADPEFYRFMELFRRVQQSRAVGMRVRETEDRKRATVMVFRQQNMEPELAADVRSLRGLLGLAPETREFSVVYGALAEHGQEIAMLSRSMLEIMVELSSFIDVPAKHVAEERTTATIVEETEDGTILPPMVQICSGLEKPDDAFTSIHYRDHWFWIEDRDFLSKRVFSFLMFLFSLAETGQAERAPVLTIPAG